jgi:hypothetical protein
MVREASRPVREGKSHKLRVYSYIRAVMRREPTSTCRPSGRAGRYQAAALATRGCMWRINRTRQAASCHTETTEGRELGPEEISLVPAGWSAHGRNIVAAHHGLSQPREPVQLARFRARPEDPRPATLASAHLRVLDQPPPGSCLIPESASRHAGRNEGRVLDGVRVELGWQGKIAAMIAFLPRARQLCYQTSGSRRYRTFFWYST